MSNPSLLCVPYRFKTSKLYSQIPDSGLGDFVVTRSASNSATRVNAAGLIETVADNVPRLDYPLGGITAGCPALLVEPSAANGILNSSDLTGANWNVGVNLTRAAASIVGLNGANLTVVTAGSGVGSSVGSNVRSANDISLTSGVTYTISFFVRITGTHTIAGYYVPITGAAAGALGGGFDVSGAFPTGVVYGTANVTNRIRRVEAWGGGVFRCSETFTMGANGLLTNIFLAPIAVVNNQANSAIGTQLAFAGPQVEQGSLPTSFIPTAASPVTRGAETISKTGVSSLIGQTEGTIYFEIARLSADKCFFSLSNAGDNTNSIRIETTSVGNLDVVIRVSNVITIQITSLSALNIGQFHKVAFGYRQNDCALYINGVLQGTDTSGAITSGMDKAVFARPNDSFVQDQRVRAIELYPTRLPNTGPISLQSLTQ